eukprot:6418037-Prymnesium_polylepis.2
MPRCVCVCLCCTPLGHLHVVRRAAALWCCATEAGTRGGWGVLSGNSSSPRVSVAMGLGLMGTPGPGRPYTTVR